MSASPVVMMSPKVKVRSSPGAVPPVNVGTVPSAADAATPPIVPL